MDNKYIGTELNIPLNKEQIKFNKQKLLKVNNVYVATLIHVVEEEFDGICKHRFTYEVQFDDYQLEISRNITIKKDRIERELVRWLQKHSNYDPSYEWYDKYLGTKNLILINKYKNYKYVEDVASLEGLTNEYI